MALEDIWNDLTEEQRARARTCETSADIMRLVKEEGYELSEDELEGIAGGYCGSLLDCTSNDSTKPYCNPYTIS